MRKYGRFSKWQTTWMAVRQRGMRSGRGDKVRKCNGEGDRKVGI